MSYSKIITFVAVVIFYSCQANGQNYNRVDVEQFESSIKEQTIPQILDVRTPGEYSVGHLEGANLVNIQDQDFKTQVSKFDKTRPVHVYCAVGGRSRQASKILEELGFSKIYDLEGGINAWGASGKNIVRD